MEIFGRVLGVRILQKRGRGQQRMAFIKQTWRDVFMHTYLELKRAVGEWETTVKRNYQDNSQSTVWQKYSEVLSVK